MIRLVDYSLSIILSPIIIISLDYKTLANSDSVCPSELENEVYKAQCVPLRFVPSTSFCPFQFSPHYYGD